MKNNRSIIKNLWGGGILFIKQFKKAVNSKNNILAFSLIELSIVLIIIGLLVAGITGGASLIESAKIKAFYDSLNQYKQALYIFYNIHDRLPGDFNLDGKIGYLSGETIKKEYFRPPYDGTDTTNTYQIPNEISAPFVELYQEKLINWEPTGNEYKDTMMTNVKGPSKIFCYFHTLTADKLPSNKSHYFYDMKLDTIFLQCQYGNTENLGKNSSKFGSAFDKKYDDGIYNSANFRAACCEGEGVDWSLATQQKCSCSRFSYIVWKN